MAKFLQSTMSAGIDIRVFKDAKGSPVAQVEKVIHINGGANVRDRNSIFTPKGVMTEVSDNDYALLSEDPTFKRLIENGFIVVTDDHHLDVGENNPVDASAQKTPGYYERTRSGKENPAPSTDPVSPEA